VFELSEGNNISVHSQGKRFIVEKGDLYIYRGEREREIERER